MYIEFWFFAFHWYAGENGLYPGVVFCGLICVRLPCNAGAITCMFPSSEKWPLLREQFNSILLCLSETGFLAWQEGQLLVGRVYKRGTNDVYLLTLIFHYWCMNWFDCTSVKHSPGPWKEHPLRQQRPRHQLGMLDIYKYNHISSVYH